MSTVVLSLLLLLLFFFLQTGRYHIVVERLRVDIMVADRSGAGRLTTLRRPPLGHGPRYRHSKRTEAPSHDECRAPEHARRAVVDSVP